MFCTKCGAKNSDEATFCVRCGNRMNDEGSKTDAATNEGEITQASKKEETNDLRQANEGDFYRNNKPNMGGKKKSAYGKLFIVTAVISVLLVIVLVLQNIGVIGLIGAGKQTESGQIGAGKQTGSGQSKGYDTPAEVALAFADALKNQDMDAALSLFGCDIQSENYDLEKSLVRNQVWHSTMDLGFPAENGIYSAGNVEKLRATAAGQIEMLIAYMGATEAELEKYLDDGHVTAEGEDASDFAAQTYSDLSGICAFDKAETFSVKVVLGAGFFNDSAASINNLKVYTINADYRGAQAQAEIEVIYEYDGQEYLGGMLLLEYDGKWYIGSLYGPSISQTASGTAEKWENYKGGDSITEESAAVIDSILSGNSETEFIIDGEYYTVDSAKEYVEETLLGMAEEYGYGDEVLSDPEELSRLLAETGELSYGNAADAALLDKISSDGVSVFTDWVELCYYCEVY